jgi:branched-subunit amino acid ABC-type transport system permease component
MDIYLLEAIINGLLLGGVLALLALGLNLIFGVIDVVWIACTSSISSTRSTACRCPSPF